MRARLERIMARYGQSVILTRRETGASMAVRAFVQPVRRQREDLPVTAPRGVAATGKIGRAHV